MKKSENIVVLDRWDDGSPKVETIDSSNNKIIKISYYKNGIINTKESMVSNIRSGPYQRFWENGKKWDETFFLDGKEHGPTTLYTEDGTIWLKGEYRHGKKIGKWVFHDPNGDIARIEEFE